MYYTQGLHCDFSRFLGWENPGINNLSNLPVGNIESYVKKRVESLTVQVDIWAAEIKVSNEGGSIQKLNKNSKQLIKYKSNSIRQLFVISLSIGCHPSLLFDFQQRKSNKKTSILDKIAYSFQGMKKFYCIGNFDMRESTGLVKIDFLDSKGSHQIMKYPRDPSQQDPGQFQSKKQRSNKKNVYIIVFCNIDRFLGQKIKVISVLE